MRRFLLPWILIAVTFAGCSSTGTRLTSSQALKCTDSWGNDSKFCSAWSSGLKCTDSWGNDSKFCSAWSNGVKCTDSWGNDSKFCSQWSGGAPPLL